MAIFTLTDGLVIVNGVTLSDHANKITVVDSRTKVDITTFGAVNTVNTKGLGDGSIAIDFFQDFAGGKVHATLSPLIASSTGIVVEVRATSAARSATNPAALITALLFDYSMLDGSIGDASVISAVFENAASAGITYPTS